MANNPGSRNTPLLGPLSMVAHLHNVPRVGKAEGGPPRRKRPTTLGAAVNEWWGADTFKDSPNPQHRQLEDVNQAIESITKRRTNADTLHVRPGFSEHDTSTYVRPTDDVPGALGSSGALTKGFAEGGDVPGGGGTTRRNVLRGLLGAGAALGVGVAKKGKGVVDSMLESKEVPAMTKTVKATYGQVGDGIHDWFSNAFGRAFGKDTPPSVHKYVTGEENVGPEVIADLKASMAAHMKLTPEQLEQQLKEMKVTDADLVKVLETKMDNHSLYEAGEPSRGDLRPWDEYHKAVVGDLHPDLIKNSGLEAQLKHQHASDMLHMLRHPEDYSPETLKSFQLEGYTGPDHNAMASTSHPDRLVMEHVKGHPIEKAAREAYDLTYPPDSFVHQLPQD